MYRIDDIVTGLTPLVGWEQDWDESKQIAEALTVSESGLHYQDAHPLLTLEKYSSVNVGSSKKTLMPEMSM